MTHPRSWHVEHACLNAWPALSNVLHDGWVVRLADGLTRRANSANPLHGGAHIPGATLQYFENLFRQHELPLTIRMPSLLDPEVDKGLERFGFEAQGESRVLFGAIDADIAKPDPAVEIIEVADQDWCDASNAMQGRSETHSDVYDDIIASIVLPAGFAWLAEEGEIVALAYGAIDGDMLVCESVITAEKHRGRGLGRRLMSTLFHWARRNEATVACLQVEAANTPALALYRHLGIATELHRYHYRRRPG